MEKGEAAAQHRVDDADQGLVAEHARQVEDGPQRGQ